MKPKPVNRPAVIPRWRSDQRTANRCVVIDLEPAEEPKRPIGFTAKH